MKRILHGALICALLVVVSVALWPASVSAAGIAIYVDDNFVDDPVNHKYNTIQKGINAATDNAGDTVYVYAGTYNENVSISKRKLILHGQSRSLVTVVGSGSGPTIEILADTVTVRQLTIRGGNPGVSWRNAGYGTLENCDITANNAPGANGVYIYMLTNQTIQCNNIYGNSNDGIQVRNSSLKDVIRNIIYSNGNDGISLINSTTMIVVARNKSYSNTRYGIYVDSTSSINDIYLNDFYGNTVADGRSDRDPLDPDLLGGNNWQTPSIPYLGNYWGDYSSTPHIIGTEQDDYPLMSSHTNYTPATQDEPAQCTPEQAPPTPPGEEGDGGKCFIATAAYGSYLDKHVETLRGFRDQYLLTNPVGRSLVSTYYKLSPPLAEFIDDHPTLKPIVRTALLPAVGLSEVAVSTTSAQKIAIVGSLALVSVALAAWARKRRGKDSPCEQPHQ